MFSAPLGSQLIPVWIVRCVGQPWSVYGQLRTADSVSHVPASNVLVSLISFAIIYTVLFITPCIWQSHYARVQILFARAGRIQDEQSKQI